MIEGPQQLSDKPALGTMCLFSSFLRSFAVSLRTSIVIENPGEVHCKREGGR
jgi:hypothetical protein